MRKALLVVAVVVLGSHTVAFADEDDRPGCSLSHKVVASVQSQLALVVAQNNGGIFSPNRMGSAVVDRQGRLCSVIKIGDAWPGSRSIAIAKASTGNDFSNDALALSTADLYSATQPGGPLYGPRLDGIPAGVGFSGTDNIDYLAVNQPPTGFKHPHCFPSDLAPGNI